MEPRKRGPHKAMSQNIKYIENLVPAGLNGGPATRSRVVTIADEDPVPDDATVTADEARDWTIDGVEGEPLITEPAVHNLRIPIIGGVNTGGGVLSWQNPETGPIVIERVVLDVTTVADGACTLDVGTTTVSGVTSSDNLIDGQDARSSIGLFDNITDKGSNGKARQKLATGKWLTITAASGDSTGLVGDLYLSYILA